MTDHGKPGGLPDAAVEHYLERIGAAWPGRADAGALRELHLRHLLAVPFENLSIHLGEDIVLDEKALVDKVVVARRGGFCYELNTAFAALLRALGYRAELLQARVLGPDGRVGIPYDHMALLVEDADGGRWLADVGFGDHSHLPLAFDERGEQADAAGVFVIRDVPGTDGDLDVVRDGTPRYRLESRPRVLADFEAGAWYHRTSPESHFTRGVICSLLTEDGRASIGGRKLYRTVAGERTERELGTDEELREAYRELFGIALDTLPAAPPAAGEEGERKS
ncbi:arylamine N-acetyltransferase [Streptomyces sp. R302]|uniref:arylamine N-acetyltransferase family protein n=1 Tax=unclassified Streptomyces TaxID=2593676 RepID=UPI00145E55C4|nr:MULTISPECIES: arylamine N-acetyltransferase [unclassified Streptomyces]NML49146.1 arylamine N-acetyltransferase [Streptomyces sp. R301]NML77473.1 arylamine N-acetyltransferase [Streptomyces sp. R302]